MPRTVNGTGHAAQTRHDGGTTFDQPHLDTLYGAPAGQKAATFTFITGFEWRIGDAGGDHRAPQKPRPRATALPGPIMYGAP